MIASDYQITILGDPKAQGRPRATKIGRFVRIYDDPKSAKEKQKLAVILQEKAPGKLLDCPLQLDLYFYFSRPKGHYGTGKNAGKLKASAPEYHTTRPDIDNLRKLITDAMTEIFWRDDSIICRGTTVKRYSEKPRIEICIKLLARSE